MLLAALLAFSWPASAEELFPAYPEIKTNVQFWEDIYSRYTTRQGVLHDQDNLTMVYDVVELVDWNTPGSAHINKKLIKLARQHYKSILTDLAAGKKPGTDDEKRVAALFPRKNEHAFKTARDNIRLQIGQKDRFMEGIVRSGAYMPAIKKIFSSFGLPAELAYLPHVESSFNPKAYSKAGAAGLWQFTRSTGQQYMMIDSVVDARYDPFLATEAAARFLKENYEALGAWPLAITAYNYGRAGMVRAVREKGSYQNIFNSHRTRIFKFASRNFYPEFLAAVNVARRIENNPGIILDRPEALLSMRMPGFIHAADIMTHFQVAEEDFRRLNPALLEPVLTGKKFIPKDFLVRLPATGTTRELAATIPQHLFQPHQVRDREHIVCRGDTAGSIARKYGISVRELVQANNLDKRATIRIGQKLKLPGRPQIAATRGVVELDGQSKARPN